MYVMLGVGASGVIFGALRYFARGDPPTMTKEYQEASNEYLKVRFPDKQENVLCSMRAAYGHWASGIDANVISHNRSRRSSPSPVCLPRTTSARVWSRASLRANRCSTICRRDEQCSRTSGSEAYARWSEAAYQFPCVDCSRILERENFWKGACILRMLLSATVQRFFTDKLLSLHSQTSNRFAELCSGKSQHVKQGELALYCMPSSYVYPEANRSCSSKRGETVRTRIHG